ncbi:MAG: hypothetical protein ACRDAU_14750 [Clostridium sp.]
MKRSRKIFLVLGVICSGIVLFGCAEKEKVECFKKVEVLEGALIEKDKEEFYNLNLNGERYVKGNEKFAILEDTLKSQLIFENGKHYILYNGEKLEIPSEDYNNLNLSTEGKYLAYMVYRDGYDLKILDLEKNLERNLDSKVSISGTFFDFINDDILVYYGISEDNKNGIFTYNLETNKEELQYEVPEGYIEFLKGNKDEIIFLEDGEEKKTLKKFILKDKKIEIIREDITFIYDIIKIKDEYFLLGNIKENGESLYKINRNNEFERIVYDFPKKIDMKKGLSMTKENNILFIGENMDSKENEVYEYKDEEIKLITENEGIYNFVKKTRF